MNNSDYKKRKIMISVVLLVICFIFLINIRAQKMEKMTVDESVQCLMNYLYNEDYLPLCTRYDIRENGPLLTVYNSEWIRCPIYEFELPNETLSIRRQIFCIGETKNREWLVMGCLSWKYYMDKGKRIYIRPIYDSRYAVNRITKKIVPERYKSEGTWKYNEEYDEIIDTHLLRYKDFYE